jgi:lipopolysaccharide export system permease protein
MIVRRYLAREVLITLTALTSILLLIFLSNQFVQYLSRAATGGIPGLVILQLMMLEVPNLLGLLLPLGLYMAVLVAYGRMYAESEMIVLQACGYSQISLIASTMVLALGAAIITGALMIWASPIIAKDRQQLIRGGGVSTLIQAIVPQRFQSLQQGKQVLYVSDMTRDHQQAEGVFLAQKEDELNENGETVWSLVWAEKGFSEFDEQAFQFIVLQNGKEYKGSPGLGNFQSISFEQYKVRLPQQNNNSFNQDIRTAPTAELLPINNPDPVKAAEIQWRLSVPLMALVLALLAVPLSKVNPRQGKYAKMLPAIILYVIYANMMFVGRGFIASGVVPIWLGLWWVHGIFLFLASFLIWSGWKKAS